MPWLLAPGSAAIVLLVYGAFACAAALVAALAALAAAPAPPHAAVTVAAAAFAGLSGGYSANFVLGTIDPLLAGLSQEAARIIDPTYTVSTAANYYFMFVSTFLITVLGWWVTEKLVAPRMEAEGGAEVDGDGGEDAEAELGEVAASRFGCQQLGLTTGGWAVGQDANRDVVLDLEDHHLVGDTGVRHHRHLDDNHDPGDEGDHDRGADQPDRRRPGGVLHAHRDHRTGTHPGVL